MRAAQQLVVHLDGRVRNLSARHIGKGVLRQLCIMTLRGSKAPAALYVARIHNGERAAAQSDRCLAISAAPDDA